MTWRTLAVTAQNPGNAMHALTDDPATQYVSQALLVQADSSGSIRVVLGFADGVNIVPADELPKWNGRVTTPLEAEVAERLRLRQGSGAE